MSFGASGAALVLESLVERAMKRASGCLVMLIAVADRAEKHHFCHESNGLGDMAVGRVEQLLTGDDGG